MLIESKRIADFLSTHSCHIINEDQTLEDKVTYADFNAGRYKSVFKYCFTEDYEKSPVEMIPCVVFYTMTDWGLPNKPMLCQNIDKNSIKLIRYVDI